MKKILITGTAGFIGFHLANRLISEGYDVVGLDAINDYYDIKLKYDRLQNAGIQKEDIKENTLTKSSLHDNYYFIKMQLEDEKGVSELFKEQDFDIVVNLAAQAGVRYSLSNPSAYVNSNIIGFLNILEACRNYPVKNLIYASSSSVYGLNTTMPFSVSANVDHPVSLYAASKKSNELMAHTYSHLFGIPTIGLRFFTVYGPWGRPDMALFLFTQAIINSRPIEIFNHGNMERDFTYIDDIVEGITLMVRKPGPVPDPTWNTELAEPSTSSAPYRIYNIGNNNPVKLMDFVHEIEKNLGMEAQKEYLPIQPGDVEKTWSDVNALIRDYNYNPGTPVSKGIKEFVRWYREYYGE